MKHKANVEDQVNEIMDFIYQEFGEKGQLRIGIWSEENTPHTFYAVIHDRGNLITGETSYGSDSVNQALDELIDDIKRYKSE